MTTDIPVINGFEFIELVRDNGSTKLWKARQTSLDRLVTVKFLYGEAAADPAQRQEFVIVARAFARVKHPGIVEVYDVVDDSAEPYIVTEWADGPTVADAVAAAHGPLQAKTALRAVAQIAEALDAAWASQRLILRNIKPTEIRLAKDQAKIANFNLAVQVPQGSDAFPTNGEVVGTPHFSAPEQMHGEPVDYRSEIFALGATLYAMLTGHAPFEQMDAGAIIGNDKPEVVVNPRDLNQKVTPVTAALISRMMAKNPSNRHQSWRELKDEIAAILANKPVRRPAAAYESMVAPSKIQPASQAATGNAAGNAAEKFGDAAGEVHRQGGSFFRAILWLILIAWIVVLGNDRLGNPLGLPFRLPIPDIMFGGSDGEKAAASDATDIASQDDAASLRQTDAGGEAETDEAAEAATTEAGQGGNEATGASDMEDDSVTLSSEDAMSLALALRDGGTAAAIEKLADLGLGKRGAGAIRDALLAIPDANELVMDTLLERAGEVVTIVYMGKERDIKPLRGVNGELFTEFIVQGQAPREVSFPIAKLSAEERIRWMPTPDDEATHSSYCLLALEAGLADSVKSHAPDCGPLAPVFQAAASAIAEKEDAEQ